MKILFFGASDLGYTCCEALLKQGSQIVGIFTIPEQFNISYSKDKPVKNYLYKDFSVLANQYQIPVFHINGDLKNYQAEVEKLAPDLMVVIGWYYMIPDAMISLCSKGAIAIHASLLPKYRGNAPLVWAMINGEKKTGISLFYLTKGVDEGDIVDQMTIQIRETDTIADVLKKVKKASQKILLKNIPLLQKGKALRKIQDHTQATVFPKRSPEDGQIDWTWDSTRIKNFIRAQTKPYPGAFTYINNKKVILWDADILEI